VCLDEDTKFVHKVLALIAAQSYKAMYVAQIASGCVMVLDDMNECDIYFSLEQWELTRPEIWGNITPTSQGLRIGYLPGVGFHPAIKDPDSARRYMREELRPRGS